MGQGKVQIYRRVVLSQLQPPAAPVMSVAAASMGRTPALGEEDDNRQFQEHT